MTYTCPNLPPNTSRVCIWRQTLPVIIIIVTVVSSKYIHQYLFIEHLLKLYLFLGGGPPPQPSCSGSDPIIDKVKTLIGPSLEGLFTIYDGDADFMKEQQTSASTDTLLPIELTYIQKSSPQIENGKILCQCS